MDFLEKLSLAGLVPVIKIDDAADAVPLCKALADGGLPVAEITFRTDAAEESIRRVHEALPEVLLCAGTVLTPAQADRAVKAGAAAIVSPGFNPEVVKWCVDNGVPVCPGISSPSQLEQALGFGLNAVKVFPAEQVGGIKLIKAMAAPYTSMRFMPTGGVSEANMLDYLSFDKILCCGGSWMVPGDAVKAKNWEKITEVTRSAVAKMLDLRIDHIGINCPDAEASLAAAKQLCAMFGWPLKEGNSSNWAGSGIEINKKIGRGTHGHIAIGTNFAKRAKWHLEQRGIAFDESSAVIKDGKLKAIYIKDEIGGFAFHLFQR